MSAFNRFTSRLAWNTYAWKRLLIGWLPVAVLVTSSCSNRDRGAVEIDVLVYGGNSVGISAGIQAIRMGYKVIVIEPTGHIGGLTTGGLGQTDIGNKHVVGGIARSFYRGIRKYYSSDENWVWQDRDDYRSGGQAKTGDGEDAMWTFEPSAAMKVMRSMIEEAGLRVLIDSPLDRVGGVKLKDGGIEEIVLVDGRRFRAKVFIDATYEGDLMAAAGVDYTVGRESNARYGETLNGVQAEFWKRTLIGEREIEDETWASNPVTNKREWADYHRQVSMNGFNHQLNPGVDPYVVPGDPSSGLLPGIDPNGPGEEGSADKRVQAYCIRTTFTDHEGNLVPIERPANYDSLEFELLARHFAAGPDTFFRINSKMPNRKTDTNNGGGFSLDYIGANYDWAEASYEERKLIYEAHRDYVQGLFWTLGNDERIPLEIREQVLPWGLPKDEFVENGNWSPQLYVREARRMIGDFVMTQHHCEGLEVVGDSIGMAAYGMDSHHMQRYVGDEGYVLNEGNVQAHVAGPYPISYRSITPKRSQCRNLLVPAALSASHVAFGSIRMEPVFMILGQSAGTAACLAIEGAVDVQDVDYQSLNERLIEDDQILELPE